VFWNLVGKLGFDGNPVGGTGGNNVALQIVVDGLKLQDCSPSYIDAREAVLDAEQLLTGGAHRCRLWTGFAKRGLGASASLPSGSASITVTESFDVPPGCGICGDVDDDEDFDVRDLALAVRALALPAFGLVAPEKCNVTGAADLADLDVNGLPDDCDAADLLRMRESLALLSPGNEPVCGPAVELFL
jgi:hypothetical protein